MRCNLWKGTEIFQTIPSWMRFSQTGSEKQLKNHVVSLSESSAVNLIVGWWLFDVVYVTFPNERFKKANKERRKVRRQKRSTITIEANKKHIKNLSNKELTNDQINLLAKGLKFIPTPVTKQTQIRQKLLRDRDRIEHFIEQANNHHPTVKFTAELSDIKRKQHSWTPTSTKEKDSKETQSLMCVLISNQLRHFSIPILLPVTRKELKKASLKGKPSDSSEQTLPK